MANYKYFDRQQMELKSMCINDFVPEDHPARIIVMIVESLDLSVFDDRYNNDRAGNPAYPVVNLLCIMSYSYLNHVFHTRKIERNCRENIVYRYLCCDNPPDHSTISRFWNRFKEEIIELITQTVYIGESQGLIDYDHLSVDGTKIKSSGSKKKIINEKTGAKHLRTVERRIGKLIAELEESISEEEKSILKDSIEKEQDYLNRIQTGLNELKDIQKDLDSRIQSGERVENRNNLHLTEKDARLMKDSNGFISGYNSQAVVDSKTNMIVSCDVSSNCNDTYLGKPMLEQTKEVIGKEKLKKSKCSLDNGYLDEELLKYAEEEGLDIYVATESSKNMYGKDGSHKTKSGLQYDENQNAFICQAGQIIPYRYINYKKNKAYYVYERYCDKSCPFIDKCITTKNKTRKRKQIRAYEYDKNNKHIPDGKVLKQMMIEKMEKKESLLLYSKRFYNIEPVFAHIKMHKGFQRFTVWGKEKVKTQWAFVCFVHNLAKIIKYSNMNNYQTA